VPVIHYTPRDPLIRQLMNARVEQGRTKLDVSTHVGSRFNSLSSWEFEKTSPKLCDFTAWANSLGYKVKLEKDQ
jgi:hypothetical protein